MRLKNPYVTFCWPACHENVTNTLRVHSSVPELFLEPPICLGSGLLVSSLPLQSHKSPCNVLQPHKMSRSPAWLLYILTAVFLLPSVSPSHPTSSSPVVLKGKAIWRKPPHWSFLPPVIFVHQFLVSAAASKSFKQMFLHFMQLFKLFSAGMYVWHKLPCHKKRSPLSLFLFLFLMYFEPIPQVPILLEGPGAEHRRPGSNIYHIYNSK